MQHTDSPCPKSDYMGDYYPIHHFTEFTRDNEFEEWYQAFCSGCSAKLLIHYRRPRLRTEQIDAMTNESMLQKRLQNAQSNDPDRGNSFKQAAPVEVLDALATYLKDAMNSDSEKKIPKLNRRFVTSFGDDCTDLLTSMGFKDIGEFYALPRPPAPDPWAWDLRKQLEDTQEELWALMRHLKENDSSIDLDNRKGYNAHMEPFEEDAQLFLSTYEYDKSKTARRAPMLTLEEQGWYAGLGCLGDMSDDMIQWAYNRQTATDPPNTPYYYDCLANIAKKRNSETLELKVAILSSEGVYSRSEVATAYKYFTLDYRQANELTDDYIRGVFESRLGSVSKSGEQEARQKLRLIGMSRGSDALLVTASDGKLVIS
jgi:ubiquitin carboxyl-terminal hydrolase 25